MAMNVESPIAYPSLDAATRESYRHEIARLPLTMRPALNQQLSGWDDLFPYEQRRLTEFLGGISRFDSRQLDELTASLRTLEGQMDLAGKGFSEMSDTMENASLLARSAHYAEWRQEVQAVFSAIQAKGHEAASPQSPKNHLVVMILPGRLPVSSIPGHKPWDPRAVEYRIDGDPAQLIELAVSGPAGLPAVLQQQTAGAHPDLQSADCWLIDADADLGKHLNRASSVPPSSLLEYAVLKPFRDQFLSQVNTVPKDIAATDQILARMRHQDWSAWWPKSMMDQKRLRTFMIELFLSGNGALIFSSAFVQWTTSEAIRRARPSLTVSRFGMRSKPKPFTSIAIFENQQKVSALPDVDDPEGSAIDALMLARYVWLSSVRYPEHARTSCISIAESSRSMYVIAPDANRPSWAARQSVTPGEVHEWMRQSLLA